MDYRWLAGFFDGEGCVYLQMMARKDRIKARYHLQITLTQNDREILDEVKEEFGGSVYQHSGRRCWRWRTTGSRALRFLASIKPYARIKKPQIDLAIEFINTMRKENLGSISLGSEVNGRRLEIHDELKSLK